MHRAIRIVSVALVGIVVLTGSSYASSADDRSDILKVREAVWRAWFANDTKTLHKLVPPDAIVISGRINGRLRPKYFNRPLTFKRKVESSFDWSSRGPRFSASGRS